MDEWQEQTIDIVCGEHGVIGAFTFMRIGELIDPSHIRVDHEDGEHRVVFLAPAADIDTIHGASLQ